MFSYVYENCDLHSRHFGGVSDIWSRSKPYQSKAAVLRINSRFWLEKHGYLLVFWVPSQCRATSTNHMCCSLIAEQKKKQTRIIKSNFPVYVWYIHWPMDPLPIIPSTWGKWHKCLLRAIKIKHYAIKTRMVLNKPAESSPHGKQERGHLLSFMILYSKSESEGSRGMQWKVLASALKGSILKFWEMKWIKKWCFEAKESI